MRIERLMLERFGRFSDAAIDLSGADVRLHVLLGDNEAGKSTTLHAIGDLLFGIDVRTPYAFQHNYDALRIAAEIRAADGRRLLFRRLKRAKNTLRDLDDQVLPDTALAPFLGGAGRPVFDGLFGLNQQALRDGGQDMLDAQGDLGRMLFEAGSHVRGLSAARKALEEEADRLFRPSAQKRVFNQALGAYQEARKRVDELIVRAEDWERNAAALDEAEAEWAEIRARRETIGRERARANRIRQLLPHIAALRGAEAALADLTDAPDMPADAESRFNDAVLRLRLAADSLERADAAAEAARAEIESVTVPFALLDRAPEIRRSGEMLGRSRDQNVDLPKRKTECAETVKRLGDLCRRLGLDLTVEQLVVAIPTDTATADLRQRISAHAAIEQAVRDAARQRDEAALEAAQAAQVLAAVPAPSDMAGLRATLDAVKAHGDLGARHTGLVQAHDAVRTRLDTRVAALPLWPGNGRDLAAAPVPDGATVARFAKILADAELRLSRAEERRAEAQAAIHDADRALARLESEGTVPTAEALAEARALRAQGWALVRRRYIAGEAVGKDEIAGYAPPDGLVAAYERSVAEADALADSHAREAKRVERHAHLTGDRAAAARQSEAATVEAEAAAGTLTAIEEEWRAAWTPAGIAPLPPREMEGWLAERARIMEEGERLATLTGERDACAALIAQSHVALRAGLPSDDGVGGDAPLAALLRRAEAILDEAVGLAATRGRLVTRHDERADAAARAAAALARAEAARDKWNADWSGALAAAGLPATWTPAAVGAALDLWQEVRRAADTLGQLTHRIEAMESDQADFAALVRRVVSEVAPDLADVVPTDAAPRLAERLKEAEAAARRRIAAGERLEAARAEEAEARVAHEAANRALEMLRGLACCQSDEGIVPAIRNAARKAELAREVEGLRTTIVQNADGLSLAEALAEADAADPEAVRAAVNRLDEEDTALLDRTRAVSERLAACKAAQADMARGHGAADAAQDMADAEAALAECARRWMVLKSAALLLGQGIDGFRQAQQGPLVTRAGELFGLLTRGSFAGLTVDYDERDRPILLGRRPDGARLGVEAMSEGARDQLFLALRLAAVELYVGAAEPLPFIADDLFVNFDEGRAGAGIEALIALGAATQVVLFTHHAHIAELATAKGGAGVVAVQRIAA